MMKKLFFITVLCCFFNGLSFGQIAVSKTNGGSIEFYPSLGIKVNEYSSLNREWIVFNDNNCPIQLKDVGVLTAGQTYSARGFVLKKETIMAFDIHHILYNVFGEYLTTLSNIQIIDFDLDGDIELKKLDNWWTAPTSEASTYLTCVSYVASVRTKSGFIWKYNPFLIQQEINKLQLNND